jgi:hypothetical protein
VVLDGEQRPRLRADIPLGDFAELGRQVERACEDLEISCLRIQGVMETPAAEGTSVVSAGDLDLASLCDEAGWPPSSRAFGHVRVAIDVPGQFLQAEVGHDDEGNIRVQVPMAEWSEDTSPACASAVALLQLRVCAAVRSARARVSIFDSQSLGLLEVGLDSDPSPGDLGHALSALSVACRMCAREAEALAGDENLAQTYLRICGRPEERAAALSSTQTIREETAK